MNSADLYRLFFAPSARVAALPQWKRPRLYIPAETWRQRWSAAAFYPAYRLPARLFRLALRFFALAGHDARPAGGQESPLLADFVEGYLPRVHDAVVLVGTPGPTQKLVVQLRDRNGRTGAYLKYARKSAARERLANEARVLAGLPDDVGPRCLRYGPFADGDALLLSPVEGHSLRASLPPDRGLDAFLDRLVSGPAVELDRHPRTAWLTRQLAPDSRPWLAALRNRRWPAVVQHGDLAPWNMCRDGSGRLRAVDWEHGVPQGFPCFDRVYYLLQTSALIHRWPPARASQRAVRDLRRRAYSEPEARALVCLAAADAHARFASDGSDEGNHLQKWRRSVWEQAAVAAARTAGRA